MEKGIVAHVPFRIHLVYLLYARSTLSVNPKKDKDFVDPLMKYYDKYPVLEIYIS